MKNITYTCDRCKQETSWARAFIWEFGRLTSDAPNTGCNKFSTGELCIDCECELARQFFIKFMEFIKNE